MADPRATIARGLDRHERDRDNAPHPFAVYVGAPTNLAALNKLAATVVGKRDRMSALAGGIVADVEKFRETKRAELADTGIVRTDTGSIKDTWGKENRSAELVKQVNAHARYGREMSEDERINIRRELSAIRDAVKATADTFTDPVSMLYSKTLDSERRHTIASNLLRQGPRACHDAMRRALALGDLELAAAALDRFDKLSDNEREHLGISKNDFAAHLVADDMAIAARLLLVIDVAGDEAELINGEAEGKNMSRARVGLGVKKRELEAMGEPEEKSGAPFFNLTTPDKRKAPTETADEKAKRLEEESNANMRKNLIETGHGSMLEALGYGPNSEAGASTDD